MNYPPLVIFKDLSDFKGMTNAEVNAVIARKITAVWRAHGHEVAVRVEGGYVVSNTLNGMPR